MIIEEIGSLTDNNPLKIKRTQKLNAKKLLTLFLSTYSPLYDLLYKSSAYNALNTIAETWRSEGKDIEIYDILTSFPADICNCFLMFLQYCPSIKIIIE